MSVITEKTIRKAVLEICRTLSCSIPMQWLVILPLMAQEKNMGSEVWLVHPSAIYECMKDVEGLAVDYSMHPYYLRVDLDGDGKMEYVLSMLSSSGWEQKGLMVCNEDGMKTIYRGIADRETSTEEKERIGKMGGVLKDAVLIENQTSKETLNSTIDKNYSRVFPWKYNIRKCCYGKGIMGGQLIFTNTVSSQAIPRGESWHPLSRNELSSLAFDMNIIDKVERITGEGIRSMWELTITLGFIQDGQFRWFIHTSADPP